VSALTGLLSGSDGNIDIMELIGKFQSGGIASLISSSLGDGDSGSISSEQLTEVLGERKIADFADNAGLNVNTAIDGLSGMIPELISKVSSDESLLEKAGGVGGLADMARKLF
jgi:uncharacterized protein YidB (DUF937 family)